MNLRATKAFTLIELLTVITVIALLAALMMPALSSGRRMAGIAACQSNLRQIGMGIQLYAEDHDSFVPGWTSRVGPWLAERGMGHVRDINMHGLPADLLCVLPTALVPSYATFDTFMCPGTRNEEHRFPGVPSYFYHPAMIECSLRLAGFDRPAALVLLHDHPYPTSRHGGRGCGVFADGHTETGDLDDGQEYAQAWRRYLAGTPCAEGLLPSNSR